MHARQHLTAKCVIGAADSTEYALQDSVDKARATLCSSRFAECLQGRPVRLETANAALLEGSGDTWNDAFAAGSDWKLVELLVP